MEEFYSTQYQSGSFTLNNVGSNGFFAACVVFSFYFGNVPITTKASATRIFIYEKGYNTGGEGWSKLGVYIVQCSEVCQKPLSPRLSPSLMINIKNNERF